VLLFGAVEHVHFTVLEQHVLLKRPVDLHADGIRGSMISKFFEGVNLFIFNFLVNQKP
jgi:hypothetical protein